MEKGFTMDQAFAEAARCLLCLDAPCSKGCPAGTDPDRFIRKMRFLNLKGAVATIKDNNALGGVCAVVCPTCSLCEQGCVASGLGEPINIGKLQRFLVEYGWQIGFQPIRPNAKTGKKVAVVGGGPSGLTCAAELAKLGHAPVVFEKRSKPGGMLRYAIPAHRLTEEFLDQEIADIQRLGVEIRTDSQVDEQADLDRFFSEGFEAVYLATGSWRCVELEVPNREAEGVSDAITFLVGAKRDPDGFAKLVGGKDVAVVGGGDTAMDAAVTASKHGAASVMLVYRRSFNEMPGSKEEKECAIEEGINFIVLTQPVEYLVEGGRVRGMKAVRNRLGEPDESGRRSPVPIEGSEHTIAAEVIVEAIGLAPDESIRRMSTLEFDGKSRIVVQEESGKTCSEKVFAGGDAVRGASIVANAVADGKRAAASIAAALGNAPTGGK